MWSVGIREELDARADQPDQIRTRQHGLPPFESDVAGYCTNRYVRSEYSLSGR